MLVSTEQSHQIHIRRVRTQIAIVRYVIALLSTLSVYNEQNSNPIIASTKRPSVRSVQESARLRWRVWARFSCVQTGMLVFHLEMDTLISGYLPLAGSQARRRVSTTTTKANVTRTCDARADIFDTSCAMHSSGKSLHTHAHRTHEYKLHYVVHSDQPSAIINISYL